MFFDCWTALLCDIMVWTCQDRSNLNTLFSRVGSVNVDVRYITDCNHATLVSTVTLSSVNFRLLSWRRCQHLRTVAATVLKCWQRRQLNWCFTWKLTIGWCFGHWTVTPFEEGTKVIVFTRTWSKIIYHRTKRFQRWKSESFIEVSLWTKLQFLASRSGQKWGCKFSRNLKLINAQIPRRIDTRPSLELALTPLHLLQLFVPGLC